MLVSMWMTKNPTCVKVTTSIDEAAQVMQRLKIRRLPVLRDDGERLVGIVSKRDILHHCSSSKHPFSASGDRLSSDPVGEIMTSRVLAVEWNRPILHAAQLMRRNKIGALPVLNKKKLVGIITESDTLDALVALLTPEGNSLTVTLMLADSKADWLEELVKTAHEKGARLRSLSHLERDGKEMAIAQIDGNKSQAFVDGLWRAGYRVLSIS